MKKNVNFLALANLLLLSCILANTSSVSAVAEDSNSYNDNSKVEEKEKLVTSRTILSVGVTQQNYTGSYRDDTKNSFIKGNYQDGYENIDVDKTYGAFIGYTYEIQFNIARIFNPYIGFDLTLGIPFTTQDHYDNEPEYSYTGQLNSKTTSTFTGNFLDFKLKAGNSFKVVKDVIDVNVYGMFGIGTTAFLGLNPNYMIDAQGVRHKSTFSFSTGFSYGYVYGGGVDVIFSKHLLIGAYFELRDMKSNVVTPKEGGGIALLFSQGNIAKYSNETIGVKIGYVF